jgi:hypothetical protein
MVQKLWKRRTPNLTFYERRRRLTTVALRIFFAAIIFLTVVEIMTKVSKPR